MEYFPAIYKLTKQQDNDHQELLSNEAGCTRELQHMEAINRFTWNIPLVLPAAALPDVVSNSRLASKHNGIIGVPIIVVLIIHTLVVVDPEIYIDIDPLIVNVNWRPLKLLPQAV